MSLAPQKYSLTQGTNLSDAPSYQQRVVDTFEGIPINGDNGMNIGISWAQKDFYMKELNGSLMVTKLDFPAISNLYYNRDTQILVPVS